MPTYEYQCTKCGIIFDHFQSIKAPKLEKCTKKGCKAKVTRLLGTGAGIIFKGGGFYETDYRSDNYKSGEKNAKDAIKKATEKKTDNKKKSDKSENKKPTSKSKTKNK